MKKQHLHYYTKKLQELGIITECYRSSIVFYKLTQLGKNILIQYEEGKIERGRFFRLHNLIMGYSIVKNAVINIPWKRVKMRNWVKEIGFFCGCRIVRTTKNMLVYANEIEGDNHFELLNQAIGECNLVAIELMKRFGIILSLGKIIREPHIAVRDPLVKTWNNFELSSNVGKIDRSKGETEIDLFSPENASEYLLMPSRIVRIESEVMDIKDNMLIFARAMNEHVALIKELRELTRAFGNTIDVFSSYLEIGIDPDESKKLF